MTSTGELQSLAEKMRFVEDILTLYARDSQKSGLNHVSRKMLELRDEASWMRREAEMEIRDRESEDVRQNLSAAS